MFTPMQVQSKNKRPLKTMGDSRLYAQGINPVLVKLDQYEATRLQPPYSLMVFAWLQAGDKVHDLEFHDFRDRGSHHS